MGRPSIFSDDYAEDICRHLAGGGSLRSWCEVDDRPHYSTVMDWLRKHDEFAANYARAREDQGHNDADRIAEVRQQVADGTLTPEQARVIIDSLKWTAGRRLPKVYGDKLDVAVSGEISMGSAMAEARERAKRPADG